MNDITSDINGQDLDVPVLNDERLSILKYIDDIVLIAESSEDLIIMLNEIPS